MTPVGHPAREVGVAAHLVNARPLDATCEVDGDDGHHLARVRRLRVGEHVTVADGRGAWRRYAVARVDRGGLTLDAVGGPTTEPAPARHVTIAPALSKGTKLETVVQQLTEIGVSRVAPWVGLRSVARLDAPGRDRLHERLTATARAAAMQSRRATLPEILPVATDLAALGVALAAATPAARRLVGVPDGDRGALATPADTTAVVVVTGPEGGFDPTERAGLDAWGARAWSFAEGVLRAETAPLAAAVLALA